MANKRILICTLVALSSGFFGLYFGGQITFIFHSQKCQNQPWGLKEMCNTWVAPGAMWQGSTTGLWIGTVLGAFAAGLATRQACN
ncbi:MAG: hypothetical protein KME32_02000 [Mojavia pulchra JT2-VF2]|jgi:hypothetical protein|uniref:Uncharacterized protein n=1 Tax=Mojavia pulchra JT2-VF2 TaxID=287848 RepID=A0A951UED9_9NOST|nr:hypothetical protein [Mojavia pulchra JT2-VF2]